MAPSVHTRSQQSNNSHQSHTKQKCMKTNDKLKVDGNPVKECLCMHAHTYGRHVHMHTHTQARTDGVFENIMPLAATESVAEA